MNMQPLIGTSLLSIACVIGACDRSANQETTPRANTTTTTTTTPSPAPKADNTDRNKVDRDSATKTPMDQDNSSEATRITADIRRAITADNALSMDARNCKIITDSSGVVTLRGPVANKSEKDAIGVIAKGVAGVKSVVNELEVK